MACSQRPFHILTKPAGPLCNLDCEYCFYLDKMDLFPGKKKTYMNEETLEEYTKQYINHQPPGTPEVNFAWQGGEPTLMGVDFFRKAMEFQEKYKRPGMEITNALQTNGTFLDDEWGKFLKEHNYLVGISIDGPEKIHDKFRFDKGGKGSFPQVMRGLEILKKYEVEYNTLTVVQSDNGKHPAQVYDFLKSIGSTFFQFIPIVEPQDDGGVSYRTVKPEQWGHFLNGILDRWLKADDVGKIFVQHFDMMLSMVVGQPATICVHSKTCGRNVAMEHNGDVFSCDHYVFKQYELGNIHEKTMQEMMDSDFQAGFGTDKYDTLPDLCRECDYLKFCYGGCPAHRIKNTPSGQPNLNHLCEGYMLFYKHSLPYFQAMGMALRSGKLAADWKEFMPSEKPKKPVPAMAGDSSVSRNSPCPCGSGKKYKRCCGK